MPSIDHLTDAELLEQLRHAVASLPDAPVALQRAAEALWTAASTPPLAARLGTNLRRLTAVLTFDSWAAAPSMTSLRSATASTRHWVFCTEGRDIDVRYTARGDGWQVSGQVLGPDAAGTVRLARGTDGAAPPLEAVLNELGEFHFDAIAAALCRVTLHFDDIEIVLPPIAVGDAPT